MLQFTLITVGTLKEGYWRDAVAEYEKRLSAFCKPNIIQLKETKLGDTPSQSEIDAALSDEAKKILAAMPPRAYKIALCVEGEEFSSEQLAKKIDRVLNETGEICLVIGSSYGLAPEVKNACQLRLSVSKLTFPHQLMRVLTLEIFYRCFGILHGTKYHK